jgi:prepilin-type N-terminal cleavage/methylation domain-containing protein
MTGRPVPRIGGFTLVELQIALLIVAIMAALMSGALRLSSKTWATVNRQQDQVEHRYLLAQYLRRHLSSARFVPAMTEKYGSVTGFFGDEKQINFVAPFPAFHQDGELYWWNFRLDQDEELNQYNLVASYFPHEDGTSLKPENDKHTRRSDGRLLEFDNDGVLYIKDVESTQMIVAENIEELRFEYFYRDEKGVQKWVERWEPGTVSPLVIRINLAFARKEGEPVADRKYSILPEILVTPRFADQRLHSEAFESAR